MLNYPYSHGDLLQEPQTYRYTPFQGEAFVDAWRASRLAACNALPPPALPALAATMAFSPTDSSALLSDLCQTMRTTPTALLWSGEDTPVGYWLPRLLKKFEVSKRLYGAYEPTVPHRPVIDSGFGQMQAYLLLAECLIHGWRERKAGYFLNALLKLTDTLVSQQTRLDLQQGAHLAWILAAEQELVTALSKELGQ
ncbi:MAG TPA: hypothetical protein VGN04_15805 [Herbaspirillum sp.]|jgi:hypothetical protein